MQQRYIPIYEESTLVEDRAPTNTEVSIVPFDDLEVQEVNQPPCETWKNCTLAYQLTVKSLNNELLTHEGTLQTNFVPGMSTAICMTSNLQFDPLMTPGDVQRVTLAALIRDNQPVEAEEEPETEARIRQSMAIYESYKGRMDELWCDMPELPLVEGESSRSGANSSSNDIRSSTPNSSPSRSSTSDTPEARKGNMSTSARTSKLDNPSSEDSADSDSDSSVPQLTSESIESLGEGETASRVEMLKRKQMWGKASRRQFFTCAYCPRRSFQSLTKYAKHLDAHHGQFSTPFECAAKSCPRSIVGFKTAIERAQHMDIYHRNHDRLFDLKYRKWRLRKRRLTQDPISVHVHVHDHRRPPT